ncbi:MAG: aspartate/tyrosine/aromatic aminotransferase [Bacteriovoracaceae bacterium]|jgi:hypothetical protein
MKEIQGQLITFLEKAYQLTTQALKLVQEQDFEKLHLVLDNRERAVGIIQSLSEKLSLYSKNTDSPEAFQEYNNQVNQVIEKISAMDDIITSCLEHEKNKTQFEIAKTFKNKENFKGYNLNNIK